MPGPVVEVAVVVRRDQAAQPKDRHAAIGRTPLRSRVHAGIDLAIAPHRPESRRIGPYVRVAPPRVVPGGERLHPVVVAVDFASVPACAVGHEQQPELRTGGQPAGDQVLPVAGHRHLGGMGPRAPVRRPLAVADLSLVMRTCT